MTDVVDKSLNAEIERLRAELDVWKQRAEAAEAMAEHDVLTPALNRRGFIRAMNKTMAYCQRHGTPTVVLYLDMDGFKSINDTYGHAAGDAALIAVAELLRSNLRESDYVGRLGGDEFAALMLNAGANEGLSKAKQLHALLQSQGFVWEGERVPLGGSFGVRAWTGHTDAEVWLTEADAAMWLRKRSR